MATKVKFCKFCCGALQSTQRFSKQLNSRNAYASYRREIHHSRPRNCAPGQTTSAEEVKKFGLLSSEWWNQSGDFAVLKGMNKLRIPWIKNTLIEGRNVNVAKPLESFKILDVGCGGGLLSEPLARLGAKVTGLDAVEENVIAANAHAEIDRNVSRNVEYICSTVEDLVDEHRESFDAVVASEVIEHVNDQPHFVRSCSELVKPDGHIFLTTISRTLFSLLFAKFAAEYIVRIVPPGVHDWEKFVTSAELTDMLRSSQMEMIDFKGMTYNLLTQKWYWCSNTTMNYACHARKPAS